MLRKHGQNHFNYTHNSLKMLFTVLSIMLYVVMEGLSVSELECLPCDWEVVGSTPGQISAVIYFQSPC